MPLDAYALRLRFRARRRKRGMVELTTGGFLPGFQTDPRAPASSPELHGYTVRGTLPRFRLQMRVTHAAPFIPRSCILRRCVRRPARGLRVPSEPRQPQQRDYHRKLSKIDRVGARRFGHGGRSHCSNRVWEAASGQRTAPRGHWLARTLRECNRRSPQDWREWLPTGPSEGFWHGTHCAKPGLVDGMENP